MKYQTLYAIINDEIEARTTNARNSATDALLWLKRYVFILTRENKFPFFSVLLNSYQVFYVNSVEEIKLLLMQQVKPTNNH